MRISIIKAVFLLYDILTMILFSAKVLLCSIWYLNDDVKCELWPIIGITGQNTGKTVAIILGGTAGVAFLVICLLFARNLMKKHDGMSSISGKKMSHFMSLLLNLYSSWLQLYNLFVQIIDSSRCVWERKILFLWCILSAYFVDFLVNRLCRSGKNLRGLNV